MVQVVLELPEELINSLKKIYPGLTTDTLIKKVLEDYLNKVSQKQVVQDEALSSIQRLLRSATDTINTYSSLLTELRDRLVEIREVLENLGTKIDELPSKITVQQVPVEAVHEKAREKITAIEILRRQKIIYEADIAKKIKNRNAFFDRLEREGAVVLSLKDQRVAIDEEFWTQFVSKVESLTTDRDSEIAKVLDKQEVALLKKLSESAIAYYERSKKKWVIRV
ncbi:MAG: hypothetical protein QN229_06425 [Desulfurococcaceae archaeon TW002]